VEGVGEKPGLAAEISAPAPPAVRWGRGVLLAQQAAGVRFVYLVISSFFHFVISSFFHFSFLDFFHFCTSLFPHLSISSGV
jgi:hypothetical protein